MAVGTHSLAGMLSIPEAARGIVIFAHGSGSSRLSPRNQAVARRLEADRLATLLMDLLDPAEEGDRRRVFDVELLATRLLAATDWVAAEPATRLLPVGYFGASTGAAAALIAAARRGERIRAVVSRGGRPDLAGPWLPAVVSPTLLIVGGADHQVIELNEAALAELRCVKQLVIVPGAGHLFEEPGALDRVAELAANWFNGHLPAAARA
ncbi:MAG: dienelactone hydrolase family protein [Chloroflexota bacterium]